MKITYVDYNDDSNGNTFKSFDWPKAEPIVGGPLLEEIATLSFLQQINDLLDENEGYIMQHNPQYASIGVLPAYTHVRYIDHKTGREYAGVTTARKQIDAATLVEHAFIGLGLRTDGRRALRALRVSEGTVLHVVADADIAFSPPQPKNHVRHNHKWYEAELA